MSSTEKTLQYWFNLGSTLHQQHRLNEALIAFQSALELSRTPTTLSAVATLYSERMRFEEALPYALEALSLLPCHPQLIGNLAVLEAHLDKYEDALEHYNQALELAPNLAIALINRGAVLTKLGKRKEALAHNKNALERLPEIFQTYFNYADNLITIFKYHEALNICEAGLKIEPKQAQLNLQRGICLAALQRLDEANQAIALAREYDPAVLMDYLTQLKTTQEAKAIRVDARHLYLESKYREKKVCYWENLDAYESFMEKQLAPENLGDSPFKSAGYAFEILSSRLNNTYRLMIGHLISTNHKIGIQKSGLKPIEHVRKTKPKIRIAYISPDFRQHATSILTCQIYGLHDRNQFEVYAYSLYNNKKTDHYRIDIEQSCDVFLDVASMSVPEIAAKIAEDEIDILIDLAGYTTHSRPELFALKPAPLQMQYLGYQATTGADFIDYTMVDDVLCTNGTDHYWQEKLVRLPGSLWPYDIAISNSATLFKRDQYGLPDDGFVFCSLNNSYKIEPLVFNVWMNLLKAMPQSVLWLLTDNLETEENLMQEAETSGVSKSRLVFAHRTSLAEHVGRLQLADLFLDSRWHNAHTTGAEALWQGLPMITCMSEQTSSRGAGSLLYALEMPELVVDSFKAYEELAIFYATHPPEYLAMREKLKAKRYTAPLFDIKLKVKHLECAYNMAWERYQAGLPPEAIHVPI
ncbi:O-linked N-acetylglucosamine transferase, SPINDLY family protein [Methyloradius palustris]|uniref:protein O-GlcNAc transferase n=1 Tax=Methyloradius palustris TaxID=2778876 RepID=A0A8D5JYK7_9PROT|nr:tetratricopeptide repeat protein [Methyloradius palustris]BCM24792.1 hypothetical protein ZMTM_10510 [Methyloradius palustris]